MKLEIYKEKGDTQKTIRLALRYDEDNDIAIVAVDENGEELPNGTIAAVCHDGTLFLPMNVDPDLDLDLDDDGCIVTR